MFNSLLMYGAMRTYPEIKPAVIRLSTKYNKANELDLNKATWLVEYIYGCKDKHKMIIAPKSLKMMSASDASYGEHVDGKSHSGGVVSFESDTSLSLCLYIWETTSGGKVCRRSGAMLIVLSPCKCLNKELDHSKGESI
jgi:hypothetical protein